MWDGLICHATLHCFYHCSKANNVKYCSLWRNDTACRPHSTTWHYRHYSTTLHLTLDTTHCALPGCRSHFTFTTFSPLTAHITTEVQEHYLTWQLASNSTPTILGDGRQHSTWFQSATSGVHTF